MAMKHFKISDSSGSIVVDNTSTECVQCIENCKSIGNCIDCKLYGNQRRIGKFVTSRCAVILCCGETKTTKLFREKIEAFANIFPDLNLPKLELEENAKIIEQTKVNRLVHNLSSINAHNIQEIYNFVPQSILASNWKTQLDHIEKEIKGNLRAASLLFLRLAKNSIHMKSEFSIYRKLDRSESVQLDIKEYPIKVVLMNVLHTFFGDFSNKGVYVHVNDYFGKIKIDYETIQVAFYHLIENATKYSKPYSRIDVSFDENNNYLDISFKMTSTYISQSERERIFEEGYSGDIAREHGKNGDGIGMWRIKQMMQLNQGSTYVECGDDVHIELGIQYSSNTFVLRFKRFGP